MIANLNFVFLKKSLSYNGDSSFATQSMIFEYILENKYSYTTNGFLKENCKNILLIESSNKFESLLKIPKNIINFILNNDVKLLFTNLSDPCNESTFKLGCEFISNQLPKNKYFLIDTNTRLQDIFTFDFFIEEAIKSKNQLFINENNSLGYISEEINIDELDSFRTKKFLCFNKNLDKAHRFSLLHEYLENDYSDSYFSFLMKLQGISKIFGKDLENVSYDFYNSQLPIELDTQKIIDKSNFVTSNTFKKELFLNSCINLVTETSFEQNELFLSEKILKPILNYQPFIVFSSYGYLKRLKTHGFKTFENYWDESYDDIESPEERYFKLLQIVRTLNSKNIFELNKLYKQTKEICIYNRNVFDNLKKDSLREIFFKILEKW